MFVTLMMIIMILIIIAIFLLTFFFVPKWIFRIIKLGITKLWDKKYRMFTITLCASMMVGIFGLAYSGLAISCIEDTDILVAENYLLQNSEKNDGIYDSYADYILKGGMSGKEVGDYLKKAEDKGALESYETYMKYAKSIRADFELEKEEYENHIGTIKKTIKLDTIISKIKPVGGIRLDDIVGRYIFFVFKSLFAFSHSEDVVQIFLCWLGLALIMITMIGVITFMIISYGIALEWPVLLIAFLMDSIIKVIKLLKKKT